MDFVIVEKETWKFGESVAQDRRDTLLGTSFEEISRHIVETLQTTGPAFEPGDDCKCIYRYSVTLNLCPELVDLFFSGAGGYRAQYYHCEELGERANKFLIDSIIARYGSEWLKTDEMRRSLCQNATSKIWVQESKFLWGARHDLLVLRWTDAVETELKSMTPEEFEQHHGFPWYSGRLMPKATSAIELKGGWLYDDGGRYGTFKPGRSNKINNYGFT